MEKQINVYHLKSKEELESMEETKEEDTKWIIDDILAD
jgi:hypothetical protein